MIKLRIRHLPSGVNVAIDRGSVQMEMNSVTENTLWMSGRAVRKPRKTQETIGESGKWRDCCHGNQGRRGFVFFFKMSFSSALRPVKMEGGKCAANQAWMLKVLEQFSSRVI